MHCCHVASDWCPAHRTNRFMIFFGVCSHWGWPSYCIYAPVASVGQIYFTFWAPPLKLCQIRLLIFAIIMPPDSRTRGPYHLRRPGRHMLRTNRPINVHYPILLLLVTCSVLVAAIATRKITVELPTFGVMVAAFWVFCQSLPHCAASAISYQPSPTISIWGSSWSCCWWWVTVDWRSWTWWHCNDQSQLYRRKLLCDPSATQRA